MLETDQANIMALMGAVTAVYVAVRDLWTVIQKWRKK